MIKRESREFENTRYKIRYRGKRGIKMGWE